MQNSPEMGPKMLFSGWAGARGPSHKMGLWDVPTNILGLPAVNGLDHIKLVWDGPHIFGKTMVQPNAHDPPSQKTPPLGYLSITKNEALGGVDQGSLK